MPFQKGVVTNPNGRPVGSRNKKASIAFDQYLEIFGENMDRLREQVATMEGKELADTLLKMAEYIFPKQARVLSATLDPYSEKKELIEEKQVFRIGDQIVEF